MRKVCPYRYRIARTVIDRTPSLIYRSNVGSNSYLVSHAVPKIDKKFGSSPSDEFTVLDGDNQLRDPNEIIFPLMKQINGRIELVGTGFFIAKFGLFMTAKHVLDDVFTLGRQQCATLDVLQFIPGRGILRRPVIGGSINNDADVGIGICKNMEHRESKEPLTNRIVVLTLRPHKVGDHVFTYAYPDTKVSEKKIALGPRYYKGTITEFFEYGRDKVLLPNPCYQTSITIHHGASGGPVFDEHGAVFGINCTGIDSMPDVSFISRINEALGLNVIADHLEFPSDNDRTVNQLVKMGLVKLSP